MDPMREPRQQPLIVPTRDDQPNQDAGQREDLQKNSILCGGKHRDQQNDYDEPVNKSHPHSYSDSEAPVNSRNASKYFSCVRSTTSGGSARAGACLFQRMLSR